MSPEQYKKLKELFNEALEIGKDERAEFVALVEDEHLRAELVLMLNGDENSGDTLEGSPLDVFTSATHLGGSIGRYTILGELGKGGMGSVYLAERSDLKGRPVALKVIRRGIDSTEILNRFRTEREILAALEHPNIAHLLDSGTTDDGSPYFVMEYVEGEDIDLFCSRRNLSLSARLELFRKVCSAVGYAHSRLIVHRDLKPSNILVTGDGEPKLLDFGIAKFASPEPSDTPGTATALGMMTPKYASPEQLRGETVGTSTDIYSLGVVLFELLTGTLPYDIGGKRIDEIVRAVCETEPERPSSVVSSAHATAGKLAADTNNKAPKTNPATAKMLRGDLDNILLKALRKEPERRYGTVDQLSDDIRRHLEGLPVSARNDTFSYRASKFVKRNRGAVISAGIVAAVLIAGIVGTVWQAVRAEQSRAKAEERFADVRSIANNVVFKYYDELVKTPGTTKVREMLITDAIDYLDKLSRDAADNVDLSRELAKAYLRIGDLQGGISGPTGIGEISEAVASMRKAVKLLEDATQRSDDPAVLADLHDAYSDLGQTLNRAGDDEKTAYLQKAVEISERLLRTDPASIEYRLELAADHIYLGDVTPDEETTLFNKGDVYFGSKTQYLKALEMVNGVLEADPANRKALERKVQVDSRLSANYQMAADAQGQMGVADQKKILAGKALEFGSAARESAEKVLALEPDNFDWQYNVSALRWNESLINALLGNYDSALNIQSSEIAAAEKLAAADPNDADTAHALAVRYDGIAATHSFTKNYAEALRFQQKALSITAGLVVKDRENLEFMQTHRDIGMNAAATLGDLGRHGESIAKYHSVFREYKNSPLMADKIEEVAYYQGLVHERIGNNYKSRKDLKAAATEFRKTIELWQKPEVVKAFFAKNTEQLDAVNKKLKECESPQT